MRKTVKSVDNRGGRGPDDPRPSLRFQRHTAGHTDQLRRLPMSRLCGPARGPAVRPAEHDHLRRDFAGEGRLYVGQQSTGNRNCDSRRTRRAQVYVPIRRSVDKTAESYSVTASRNGDLLRAATMRATISHIRLFMPCCAPGILWAHMSCVDSSHVMVG